MVACRHLALFRLFGRNGQRGRLAGGRGSGFWLFTMSSASLPPDPSSVPAARQLVHEVTAHLPRRAREAAELVASELATNSVVHAGTVFEVFAAADEEAVEV